MPKIEATETIGRILAFKISLLECKQTNLALVLPQNQIAGRLRRDPGPEIKCAEPLCIYVLPENTLYFQLRTSTGTQNHIAQWFRMYAERINVSVLPYRNIAVRPGMFAEQKNPVAEHFRTLSWNSTQLDFRHRMCAEAIIQVAESFRMTSETIRVTGRETDRTSVAPCQHRMCGTRRKERTLKGQLQETVIVWNQKDDEIGKATRLQKRHRGMERRPLVFFWGAPQKNTKPTSPAQHYIRHWI